MKEKTKIQEEDRSIQRFFSDPLRPLHPEKGITARDYFDALDCHVKVPMQVAYLELCEMINGLPESEMERASNFLQIQKTAFFLWEQIDKRIMEDYKASIQA